MKLWEWQPRSASGLLCAAALLEADGGGEQLEWNIETSSPATLMRFGWTRDSLKSGDRVSVLCHPLIDGFHGCRLVTVFLVDTVQALQTKLSLRAVKHQIERDA